MPYGAVRFGGTVAERLRLGGALALAGSDCSAGTPGLASLAGVAILPPTLGVRATLGLGLGARARHSNVDGLFAPVLLGGASYEIPLSSTVAITPSDSWIGIAFAYPTNLVRFGIAVTLP